MCGECPDCFCNAKAITVNRSMLIKYIAPATKLVTIDRFVHCFQNVSATTSHMRHITQYRLRTAT